MTAMISIFLGGAILTGAAAAGGPGGMPRTGAKILDAGGHMQISAADRCPVCAMLPIKYPRFASAIQLKNKQTYYFCSTGCMIRAWMHPDLFLNVSADEILRAVVRDYFSGDDIDANAAHWIGGSDVIGPMGPALVPLKTVEEVESFRRRHGGGAPFLLDDMNDALWEKMTRRKAVR